MSLKRCSLILCGVSLVWGAAPESVVEAKQEIHAKSAPPLESTAPLSAKVIHYSEREVARVNTKLRYTTLMILPKNEQILDFACGDKEYWVVQGAQNIAYVKPAKAGAATNLNLVTASGNVYSFVLAEVSDSRQEPDLKVFVELASDAMASAAGGSPRFVSAQDLESARKEAASAREEIKQVKQASQTAIDTGISRFISNVRFPYHFEAGKKPFYVRAMYHDGKCTYIQARPEETPTLYELKDGQPNMINFEYKDGVYVAAKILDRGYLAVGKQKLAFAREE
jgi:type IV secretory pathway VirB9-like protein